MRAGPILCPFCNERVPRAAIRCAYCNMWLTVGIFRADVEPAADPAVWRAGALGRVIYLTPADFSRLEYLARIERNPNDDPLAKALLDKLGHAVVVSSRHIPTGTVTVHSTVRIVLRAGLVKEVTSGTLRYPDEGGAVHDTISVLSPLGLALLGLVSGETATYGEADGRSRTVSVERVFNGESGKAEPRRAAVARSRTDDGDPGPSAA
jgi:regulator of nucleoside diphosphate kinase